MRNPNKYQRNKAAKLKARRRAFKLKGGPHSIKSWCPSPYYNFVNYTHEEQLKNHKEFIETFYVRGFLNGFSRDSLHTPKWLKKSFERSERHRTKIELETGKEITFYKHDADSHWFLS